MTTTFTYDGDGRRASLDAEGVTTRYVYDVNRSLPVLLDDGERKYVWGMGLAYAVERGGDLLVYHADGLGSIRAITDGAGAVARTYRTDEFGVPIDARGGEGQPFGYTGEQVDPTTGLVYLRARYYDPALGRFLTRDAFPGVALSPQTLNRYSYVTNNPTTLVDPSGHLPVVLVLAWALAEVGLTVWDAIETAETFMDPRASYKEKLVAGSLFLLGVVGPGGGYGHIPRIIRYAEAKLITRGQRHTYEAHHILEVRRLKNWQMHDEIASAPAVVLPREEHLAFTRELQSRLKPGIRHEKEEVWAVYQDVYKDHPEYLDAIRRYFE